MILIVVPNQLKNICNMLIHKSKTSCRNTHINASGTRKKERKKDSSIEWYNFFFRTSWNASLDYEVTQCWSRTHHYGISRIGTDNY